MVEGIVKKIMTTGITKYAKAYNVPAEQVQIRVTNDPNGTVFYTMYKNFKEVERITFLQIMDKNWLVNHYCNNIFWLNIFTDVIRKSVR